MEDAPEDESVIRQLVADWMQATREGDLETLLGLMTEDVVFMVPGQEPFGKEAFAAASERTDGTSIDGTADIVELEIHDRWALTRTRIEVMITTPSGTTHRSGYTLSIMRKDEGRWRLWRDANLLAPP